MNRDVSPTVRSFSLQPGRNCWRRATAERLAFLIDGAAYFDAFYRAALNAERSIMILSWGHRYGHAASSSFSGSG